MTPTATMAGPTGSATRSPTPAPTGLPVGFHPPGATTLNGPPHQAGAYVRTGSPLQARSNQTATLLPNGKVLIAGGLGFIDGNCCIPVSLASAELYDPVAGTFTATGSMTTARSSHTATLLKNGKVLIVDRLSNSLTNPVLSSAELYDPVHGTFTAIAGSLAFGGAEIYDPATGQFTSVRALGPTNRFGHSAVLLDNGQILIAGGSGGAFLINPACAGRARSP